MNSASNNQHTAVMSTKTHDGLFLFSHILSERFPGIKLTILTSGYFWNLQLVTSLDVCPYFVRKLISQTLGLAAYNLTIVTTWDGVILPHKPCPEHEDFYILFSAHKGEERFLGSFRTLAKARLAMKNCQGTSRREGFVIEEVSGSIKESASRLPQRLLFNSQGTAKVLFE